MLENKVEEKSQDERLNRKQQGFHDSKKWGMEAEVYENQKLHL